MRVWRWSLVEAEVFEGEKGRTHGVRTAGYLMLLDNNGEFSIDGRAAWIKLVLERTLTFTPSSNLMIFENTPTPLPPGKTYCKLYCVSPDKALIEQKIYIYIDSFSISSYSSIKFIIGCCWGKIINSTIRAYKYILILI